MFVAQGGGFPKTLKSTGGGQGCGIQGPQKAVGLGWPVSAQLCSRVPLDQRRKQVWSSLVKSGQVWSSLVNSGQLWSSLANSG